MDLIDSRGECLWTAQVLLQLLHTQCNCGHHIGVAHPDHLDHLGEGELIFLAPHLREGPDVTEGVHIPISHLAEANIQKKLVL